MASGCPMYTGQHREDVWMSQQGLLLVISGPSGAGKGSICRELFRRNPQIVTSVSVTTRAPRAGEEEGIHYFFRTREQFEKMIENGEFLEHAEVYGNYYGTPRAFVREQMAKGRDVALEIDIQGALRVKERFDEGVFIFIVPPSMEELRARLVGRKSETEESLLRRFQSAYQELNFITRYNYVVVNDQIERAAVKVQSIITAEKCRVDRNTGLNLLLQGGTLLQ